MQAYFAYKKDKQCRRQGRDSEHRDRVRTKRDTKNTKKKIRGKKSDVDVVVLGGLN